MVIPETRRVLNSMSTGVISGAEITYPSGALEFTPGF